MHKIFFLQMFLLTDMSWPSDVGSDDKGICVGVAHSCKVIGTFMVPRLLRMEAYL